MSGHNKWSTIKHKKGKEDARRGKIFTKLARYIIVAVKEGGVDPEYNPALKTAIEKAKAENMPNDNIERALKKGSGDGDSSNYETIIYEGYGPEGIAVVVECLTDNRNRTAADVRHAFDKHGGNLGQNGSVLFMFDKKGVIVISRDQAEEDELMDFALENGASDFESDEEGYTIYSEVADFISLRDALQEKGYTFSACDLEYVPSNNSQITNQDNIKKMVKMIDQLEDNDDVQNVYHNWEIPEDLDVE